MPGLLSFVFLAACTIIYLLDPLDAPFEFAIRKWIRRLWKQHKAQSKELTDFSVGGGGRNKRAASGGGGRSCKNNSVDSLWYCVCVSQCFVTLPPGWLVVGWCVAILLARWWMMMIHIMQRCTSTRVLVLFTIMPFLVRTGWRHVGDMFVRGGWMELRLHSGHM